MFVKPIPGRVVRDPATKIALPPEGAEVPGGDLYWHRRIAQGDVVEESPAVAAASQQARRAKS